MKTPLGGEGGGHFKEGGVHKLVLILGGAFKRGMVFLLVCYNDEIINTKTPFLYR